MRKIQPAALEAAKAHHIAEATDWLRALSLQEAPSPSPAHELRSAPPAQ